MTRRDFLQGLASGLAAIAVNLSQDQAREQTEKKARESNRQLGRARDRAEKWLASDPECDWLSWETGQRAFRAERQGQGWRLLEHVNGEVIVRHTDQGGSR